MARTARFPPQPSKHKSGQARITWKGKDYYFGPWGAAKTKKRIAEFYAQLASTPDHSIPEPSDASSVRVVLARFLVARQAELSSKEYQQYQYAFRPLCALFGSLPASGLSPKHLRTFAEALASGSWLTAEEKKNRPRCKWTCNKSVIAHKITRIKTAWRWAEVEGLVPAGAWHHLLAYRGFGRADRSVRDKVPRKPVTWPQVEAILPILKPGAKSLVLFLWHTGCRPSEGRLLRAEQIDIAKKIVKVQEHKGAWRGQERIIALGPQAAKVLSLCYNTGFVFRPKTVDKPYGLWSFGRAIRRACQRAQIETFTPYQLRHAAKARFTAAMGLDAARAALGQISLGTTNLYAQGQDAELARQVAQKLG
jgi:integrase